MAHGPWGSDHDMDHDGAPLRSLVARSRQREHAAMTMRQSGSGSGTRTFIFHTHPLYAELVFLQDTFHTRVEILSRGVAEKLRERNGNDTFDESVRV